MEIVKIRVKNYRALKDFSMDWQKTLSLIIGKNNCGKTSLISIMQTFFSEGKGPGIRYDDFNLEFKLRLTDCIACKKSEWDNTDIQGIELFLYIEYNESDNIANISPLLMDLDPDNHMVVLKIEYVLNDINQLKMDYDKYFEKLSSGKKNARNKQQLFERFMRDKSKNYFKTVYKAIKYDYTIHECNPDIFTILDKNILHLSRIVSIKSIGAKRETDNKENDTSLSSLSNQYYERVKGEAGDAVKKKEIKGKGTYYVACEVEKGEKTSNHALNYYFKEALENWGRNDLTFFKKQNARQKVLSYIQKNWQQNEDGKLMIAYQTKEENGKEYYPRSFEDAFFCCNRQFIIDNISNFHCLKNKKYFDEKDESGIYQYSPYELAEKCVKSKPAFPMEVLLNSESDGKCDYSNWKIPSYIKEGLLWLKQD